MLGWAECVLPMSLTKVVRRHPGWLLAGAVVWYLVLCGVTAWPMLNALNPRPFEGTLLQATYNPSAVKSIQRNTCLITTGNTTGTRTITAVTTANTLLTYNGFDNGGTTATNPAASFTGITLTNSTTVTCNMNTAPAGVTNTTYFVVTEYLPTTFATAPQYFALAETGGGAQSSYTISPALTATTKADARWLGTTYTNATYNWRDFPAFDVASTSSLATHMNANANSQTIYGVVWEWR